MNLKISLFAVFALIFASGCRTDVGTYDYGHHSSVSVGVHGDGKAATIAGALLVGGLIGNALSESAKKKKEKAKAEALQKQQEIERQKLANQKPRPIDKEAVADLAKLVKQAKESAVEHTKYLNETLAQLEAIQKAEAAQTNDKVGVEDYQQELAETSKAIQWYQVGKDGLCYLMSVDNGVTDIVESVDSSHCK